MVDYRVNMTDREKLINLMGGHCDYAGHIDCKEDCAACLADHLLANGVTFATDTNVGSKWISVEDRLPETGVLVLVIVSGKPAPNITLEDAYELAEYDPEGWILEMWPEWMNAEVSYWMPLPEPPEEDKHG